MKINRALNFVIPIYGADGKTVDAYVHAIPLEAEVVDRYFMVLGQTFNQIFAGGLGIAAGPGHSMRILKRVAMAQEAWDGEDGVERGLLEEIRRGMMVIVRDGHGWSPVPLQVAVDRKVLDAEDKAEVENAVVFFIAVSATLERQRRRAMLERTCDLWAAQISSSNASGFASSLPRSIATASSGETPHAAAPTPGPGAPATEAPLRLSRPS